MNPRWAPARTVVVGAIAGMVGGMMMVMVEMLYGWASLRDDRLSRAA